MRQFIDLSQPLVHGQPNFAYDPKISVTTHQKISILGYNMAQITMGTHQGTHLDAPFHFIADGKTIDQMKLEQFFGEASLIDLAPGSFLAAGTNLTVAMFKPFESLFRPGAKIIYRTGWDRLAGQEEYFTGFPSLELEAAEWIANRKIGLLGMDTPTPSREWLKCHHILLGHGTEIVIVEGLINLDRLPGQFTFIGFPLNMKGRDGAPIRAVAMIEAQTKPPRRDAHAAQG